MGFASDAIARLRRFLPTLFSADEALRDKPGPDPEELAGIARRDDAQTLARAAGLACDGLKARLFFEHIAAACDSYDELRRAQDLADAGFPLCAVDEALGIPPFHFLAQNGQDLCWDWLTGLDIDWGMPDASGQTLSHKLAGSLSRPRARRLAWLYKEGHAQQPLIPPILKSAQPEAAFILETDHALAPILRDPGQWGSGDQLTRSIAKAWCAGLAYLPEAGMRTIADRSLAEQTLTDALCLCAHADSPSGIQACLAYANAFGMHPDTEGAFAIAWGKMQAHCLEALAPRTAKYADPGLGLRLLCQAGAGLKNHMASKCVIQLAKLPFPETETSCALRNLLAFSHVWDDLEEHLYSLDWAQALLNNRSLARAWSHAHQHSGLPSSTAFMRLSQRPAVISALEQSLFNEAIPKTQPGQRASRSL